MHDAFDPDDSGNLLIPLIIGLILLASVPLLFRRPVTAFRNPLTMSMHAYELSFCDSTWNGRGWIFSRIAPPTPGRIAFGTHEFYPLYFFSARDSVSGDALIRMVSPGDLHVAPRNTSWQDMKVSFAGGGGNLLVLIRGSGRGSWPADLFSIITHR
ncbi:MAG: hypothetical protein JXA64_02000 [Candidatus Fermentibacteraceae bacterium]|nr:hypothetical protein [Candidatus Fermentibacteraceae bacterium]